MFLLASVAFWTVRAQGIVWGYYNLFNIARLPDAAFHGFFKAFFHFAIPMLLVANVPVKLLHQPPGIAAGNGFAARHERAFVSPLRAFLALLRQRYTSASA